MTQYIRNQWNTKDYCKYTNIFGLYNLQHSDERISVISYKHHVCFKCNVKIAFL